jgi:hypothetical protein
MLNKVLNLFVYDFSELNHHEEGWPGELGESGCGLFQNTDPTFDWKD